jgi:hypothetical protein
MRVFAFGMERLRLRGLSQSLVPTLGEEDDRSPVPGRGRGGSAAVRRLRCTAETGLTAMLMILLYGVGAAGIAVYMIAALVFPEKF